MNLLVRRDAILEKKVTRIRHFYKISGQRNVTLNEITPETGFCAVAIYAK